MNKGDEYIVSINLYIIQHTKITYYKNTNWN